MNNTDSFRELEAVFGKSARMGRIIGFSLAVLSLAFAAFVALSATPLPERWVLPLIGVMLAALMAWAGVVFGKNPILAATHTDPVALVKVQTAGRNGYEFAIFEVTLASGRSVRGAVDLADEPEARRAISRAFPNARFV